MPTNEEMDSMMHYHLELVHDAAGTSVVELIETDRHRYCAEVIRAEMVDAFSMLGYTFVGETLRNGRSEVLFTFKHDDRISAGFAITDCTCPEGEATLLHRQMRLADSLN